MNESEKGQWVAMLNDLDKLPLKGSLKQAYSDDKLLELWQKLGSTFEPIRSAPHSRYKDILYQGGIDEIVTLLKKE